MLSVLPTDQDPSAKERKHSRDWWVLHLRSRLKVKTKCRLRSEKQSSVSAAAAVSSLRRGALRHRERK